jgi:hypothetical protein
MPTVLRWEGFRFYFFSNEAYEPPTFTSTRAETRQNFGLSLCRSPGMSGFPTECWESWKQKW